MENVELTENEYRIIDEIRRTQTNDKTYLSSVTNLSWPTVSKVIDSLKEKGYILEGEGPISLNPEAVFYIGIAVGAREIKAVLCDFNFHVVELSELEKKCEIKNILDKYPPNDENDDESRVDEYVCLSSAQQLDQIAERLCAILKEFLSLDINVGAIGIAFPGTINTANNVIGTCPNIPCLTGKSIFDLLKEDLRKELLKRKIEIVIQHNAKACFISEKEQLYHSKNNQRKGLANSKDIICVYHGTGIGIGGCVNGVFLTGTTNSFGEFGHILAPDFANENSEEGNSFKCPFCQKKCLESLIRTRVFRSNDLEAYKANTHRNKLKNFASTDRMQYEILVKYVGFIINTIVNIFNPQVLILTGRLYDCVDELWNDMQIIKGENTLSYSGNACTILDGSRRQDTVAIGAAMFAYYKTTSYKDGIISWPMSTLNNT